MIKTYIHCSSVIRHCYSHGYVYSSAPSKGCVIIILSQRLAEYF